MITNSSSSTTTTTTNNINIPQLPNYTITLTFISSNPLTKTILLSNITPSLKSTFKTYSNNFSFHLFKTSNIHIINPKNKEILLTFTFTNNNSYKLTKTHSTYFSYLNLFPINNNKNNEEKEEEETKTKKSHNTNSKKHTFPNKTSIIPHPNYIITTSNKYKFDYSLIPILTKIIYNIIKTHPSISTFYKTSLHFITPSNNSNFTLKLYNKNIYNISNNPYHINIPFNPVSNTL